MKSLSPLVFDDEDCNAKFIALINITKNNCLFNNFLLLIFHSDIEFFITVFTKFYDNGSTRPNPDRGS